MMTPDQASESVPVRRVSVLGRFVPAFSYAITAPACIISALLLFGVMRAMRMAEAAGLSAVAGGMAEANLPISLTLYFATAVGLIGIIVAVVRLFTTNTTASPSAWFFLLAGCIGLAPLLLLWQSETVFIQAISPGSGGIARAASSIQLWLTLTIIFAFIADSILLIASLVPLPAVMRTRRSYAPLLVLVMMEVGLIGMAVAFQMRTSWLRHLRFGERF
jgi:hypothetical protein